METSTITDEIAAAGLIALAPLDSQSCDLLRAVVDRRTEVSGLRIKQLAPAICDWNSLFNHAYAHGILPLLFTRMQEASASTPSEVQQYLQTEYSRNVLHCFANAAELIALLDAFNRKGIPAMPFKGVVLAASVYGDLSARRAGDLDFLIHYSDLQRATAVLQERNYDLITPAKKDGSPALSLYYEYRFERKTDGMITELRWRLELVQPRFRKNLGLNWAQSGSQTAILAGAEVPNPGPEKMLLMLCMHGSRHIWGRLLWICDVAQLIESERGLNWNATIREARRTGLWRSLALGVLLAKRIAGARLPDDVLNQFASHSSSNQLAQYIAQHIFDSPGTPPEGLLPYNVRLLGPRDRVMSIITFNFMRPGARDLALVRLPKLLHVLYWFIRPIRVLKDRSARH